MTITVRAKPRSDLVLRASIPPQLGGNVGPCGEAAISRGQYRERLEPSITSLLNETDAVRPPSRCPAPRSVPLIELSRCVPLVV